MQQIYINLKVKNKMITSEILGNPIEETLLRELIYGESQRKKSLWAAGAADAGFNVLILNGDKPATIYKLLSKEAQSRIRIVNAYGKFNFADLVRRLLRGEAIWWDITESKPAFVGLQNKEHAHFKIDFSKLTSNDVLILDSWTAEVLAVTNLTAEEKKIDLGAVEKLEWSLYGSVGMHLNWVIDRLRKLPCHVIVIGHEDIWEKHKKDSSGKLLADIEFTKTQFVSSSRPHAATMPKFFTDTLYFYMVGNMFYITSEPAADRIAGSTTIAPNRYKWDELSFGMLCKLGGIPTPDGKQPFPAIEYYPVGSLGSQQPNNTQSSNAVAPTVQVPMLNAVANTGKAQTLADLMKKGSGQ